MHEFSFFSRDNIFYFLWIILLWVYAEFFLDLFDEGCRVTFVENREILRQPQKSCILFYNTNSERMKSTDKWNAILTRNNFFDIFFYFINYSFAHFLGRFISKGNG